MSIMDFIDDVVSPMQSIFGPVLSGMYGKEVSTNQQSWSERQADKLMGWQERLSNTAYQRAADDLEKAGLNRVLALGSPAGTPSGGMGQSPDVASNIFKGMSTAAQVGQAYQDIKKTSAEADIEKSKALLVKGAIDEYRSNSAVQKKINQSILTEMAGVRPELGVAGMSLIESIKDIWNSGKSILQGFDNVKDMYKRTDRFEKELRSKKEAELLKRNIQKAMKKDGIDKLPDSYWWNLFGSKKNVYGN